MAIGLTDSPILIARVDTWTTATWGPHYYRAGSLRKENRDGASDGLLGFRRYGDDEAADEGGLRSTRQAKRRFVAATILAQPGRHILLYCRCRSQEAAMTITIELPP